MSKVLYLFGAGASAQSLPVVEGIPNAFDSILNLLSEDEFKLSESDVFDSFPDNKKKYYQDMMIEDLKWLKDESANHASVDTFAKKLELIGNKEELKRLKIALSIFFLLLQSTNKADQRYDTFYASIFTTFNEKPKNIKILSWNYDSQFEQSYVSYSRKNDLADNYQMLWMANKHSFFSTEKNPFIFKLNGTTGFSRDNGWHDYNFMNSLAINREEIENLVLQFANAKFIKGLYSSLSFAWENWDDSTKWRERIKNQIADYSVLIVVGYSFPFFNREVDKDIFSGLKKLSKIYVQDLYANEVIERVEALLPNFEKKNIIPITNCKQFYLPNEL